MSLRRPKMQIKPKVANSSSQRPTSNKNDSSQESSKLSSSQTQPQSLASTHSSDTISSPPETPNVDQSKTVENNDSTINEKQSVDNSNPIPIVIQKRKKPTPKIHYYEPNKHLNKTISDSTSDNSAHDDNESNMELEEDESLIKESESEPPIDNSSINEKTNSISVKTTKITPILIEESDKQKVNNSKSYENTSQNETITNEKVDESEVNNRKLRLQRISNATNDESLDSQTIVTNEKNPELEKPKESDVRTASISKIGKDVSRKRRAPKTRSQTDKTKMTMRDLLAYNPPMTEEQKEQRKYDSESEKSTTDIPNKSDKQSEAKESAKSSENSSGPRVKVGADGCLILDEESVIVKRKKSDLDEPPVIETAKTISACTNYSSFRTRAKSCHKPRWNEHETVRFYSALNLIGTDFTLMSNLFFKGKRTRLDLRNKFKKEEKLNKLMIDEALSTPGSFITQCEELNDLLNLEETSSDESDNETEAKSEAEKESKSKSKVKT